MHLFLGGHYSAHHSKVLLLCLFSKILIFPIFLYSRQGLLSEIIKQAIQSPLDLFTPSQQGRRLLPNLVL